MRATRNAAFIGLLVAPASCTEADAGASDDVPDYLADWDYDGWRSYTYGGFYNYSNWVNNGDNYYGGFGADEQCVLKDALGTAGSCDDFKDDGECDFSCNYEECDWDGEDCFYGDDGCYVEADGNDYRGNVSTNTAGKECAVWSDENVKLAYFASFGVPYVFTTSNYPDANLGGHNSCRNPDHGIAACTPGPDFNCPKPWCLHWEYGYSGPDEKLGWAFCDVGPPKAECPGKKPLFDHYSSALKLDTATEDSVGEHQYKYYTLAVPASLEGLQVVLVPLQGTPRLFADFDVPNPTGHNATYEQLAGGVSVLRMKREMFGFCGKKAKGDKNEGACTLHLSVLGADDDSMYSIVVYDSARAAGTACAEKCDWPQLGDGDCDPHCDNDACFHDRGDCALAEDDNCPADCKPDWIGDGYCDTVCFTLKCSWDGQDCGGNGCADGCLGRLIDDGKCDAQCNVRSCLFDGKDCFHGHHECYTRPNGADYRGTVSHTTSGKQCQKWSSDKPHVHGVKDRSFPTAGIGGHNFCRNPDNSEGQPWCYTLDEDVRYEVCDVGEPQESCPPPPPPHTNFVIRHWPHSPPRPGAPPHPPPPPPPVPCPAACAELASDGKCDSLCNSTVCLWDKGDCGDLLGHLLDEVGAKIKPGRLQRLREVLSSDMRAQAMALGLVLGVVAACIATCVCLWLKHKRKMAGHNQSARNYTPYGESAGPPIDGGDMEMSSTTG